MKKVTEVCYSNSMKINRGQYEQEAPFYSAKTILEENGQPIDEVAEYNRLRGIIDPLLTAQYQESKLEMSGLRVRIKDGKKYISVTSILSPDFPKNIDPEYAIRGTEIHRIFTHWVTTGQWLAPSPSLLSKLKFEDIPYREFTVSFKDRFKAASHALGLEVYHSTHLYSGEIDAIMDIDGKKSLVDFKTGSWDWLQLVAYYKALNDKDIKQLVIFDLKNTKLEVLPVTDPKCTKYWESFLIKRGEIKARFGV